MPSDQQPYQGGSLKSIVKYFVASVLLIHLFGVFGIFIALSYPLWWFFLPQQAFCFYCLHISLTKSKGECPVCRREVKTIFNPPFRAVFANMVTILGLSFFAFIIVSSELLLLSQAGLQGVIPFSGKHAHLVIPEKNRYYAGGEFTFDVNVEDPEQPINVVQADMEFDSSFLEVDRIDTTESFATIFTQKDFSNKDGWIRIVGGLPSPGFSAAKGLFARIHFKPRKSGIGRITFMQSSRLLANDGKGTNLLAQFDSSSIVVHPENKVYGISTSRNIFQNIFEWLGK